MSWIIAVVDPIPASLWYYSSFSVRSMYSPFFWVIPFRLSCFHSKHPCLSFITVLTLQCLHINPALLFPTFPPWNLFFMTFAVFEGYVNNFILGRGNRKPSLKSSNFHSIGIVWVKNSWWTSVNIGKARMKRKTPGLWK